MNFFDSLENEHRWRWWLRCWISPTEIKRIMINKIIFIIILFILFFHFINIRKHSGQGKQRRMQWELHISWCFDSPVSLWFAFRGRGLAFGASLTAGAGSAPGPRYPERLKPFTGPFKGELHLLAFPQAPKSLHHQFTLETHTHTQLLNYKITV